MTIYRCYLLGEDGKIQSSQIIECPTDAAALEEAERRLAACGFPAIEVWDKGRRIGLVGHAKDPSERASPNRGARTDPSCVRD